MSPAAQITNISMVMFVRQVQRRQLLTPKQLLDVRAKWTGRSVGIAEHLQDRLLAGGSTGRYRERSDGLSVAVLSLSER